MELPELLQALQPYDMDKRLNTELRSIRFRITHVANRVQELEELELHIKRQIALYYHAHHITLLPPTAIMQREHPILCSLLHAQQDVELLLPKVRGKFFQLCKRRKEIKG